MERRGPAGDGEAGELSEPAWLWPKHTMLSTAERRNVRHLISACPPSSSGMVRSAVPGHQRAPRTA